MGCGDADGTVAEFQLDVRDGSKRQRHSDERVLLDGLIFTSLHSYCGSE